VARPTALVVEDSPEFVVMVSKLLEREGFAIVTATTGDRGVVLAREARPELIVLDITLPDTDGFEVCRLVREFSDAYIVMLSARDEEIDKVLGLTVGADDYVTKPFSPRELGARIKAVRRRPRVAAVEDLRDFGDLRVDVGAREVSVDGDTVELTRIEFDILDLLSGAPRQTFTRAQLMENVWGESWFGDDHVIDVHVGNLRRKVGESASEPRHIRTVRGVGYRFDP
jgi:DNA-binding response OmpR family regulator